MGYLRFCCSIAIRLVVFFLNVTGATPYETNKAVATVLMFGRTDCENTAYQSVAFSHRRGLLDPLRDYGYMVQIFIATNNCPGYEWSRGLRKTYDGYLGGLAFDDCAKSREHRCLLEVG